MSSSEQIVDAEELLRRKTGAPFSGPLLDLAADRLIRVPNIPEEHVAAVVGELHRVVPEGQPLLVEPAKPGFYNIRIDPLPTESYWRSAQRLHSIIGFLRSPDGCPWDRAQSWESLAPKVTEEAYEVVDAIEDGDPASLAGELGDLLLIVALMTQIAEEQGAFTIEDVYELVNRKLIRRHPHVFGDDAADTPETVLSTWRRVKREERGDTAKPLNEYDRLPRAMPAIEKAALMRDLSNSEPGAGPSVDGEQLLQIMEAMLAAGRDPEAELQAALDRKYKSN